MASPPSASRAPTAWSWRWLPIAGLVVAVVTVYWNSLQAPFLFDDAGAVLNNPTIRCLASFAVLNPPADGSTTTGRPLVNLSFALNYALSGERVWSYHVTNIATHALATLALFGLVRRTLVSLNYQLAILNSCAFFAALLWALHPVQTESVVCIAQRTETLCGLCYLLTLYAFSRATLPLEGEACSSRRAWLAVSVTACLAGMASKEVMITAPLVVFLFDRTFVAGTFTAAWRERRGYYLAVAATWLLLGWLVLRGGGARGIAAGFGLGVSTWSYLLRQCEALVLYARLSLWPHPLVLDYGNAVVRSPWEVWWQGLFVLGALVGTAWALVRRPVAGFAGTWFFLILAPSSSFVPLVTQTMAEHRMYLPLAVIVVPAVMGIFHWRRRLAVGPLGAIAVVLAVGTIARNRDYRDAVTIWTSSVVAYPESARAQNNLGWALQQAGRPADASAHFSRAVALNTDYVSARYNWGVALVEQGRPAEAVVQLENAVRLAPDHVDARVNLGNALVQARRPGEAIEHYAHALQFRPAADVYYNLGVTLVDLNRGGEAIAHLRAALELNASHAESHYQLGRALEQVGRPEEAEAAYAAALRVAPDHVGAHRRLGLLNARRENLPAAAEHFQAILRREPSDADAQANLGNVLLLQGRPREAIERYEEALRLRPDDPRTQENLRLAREAQR